MVMGLLGGTLGGMASYLLVAFDGFKAIPNKPKSKSKTMQQERLIFFICRCLLGAITGFIITCWFIEDVTKGQFGVGKLFFIQAISGVSSSLLMSFTEKIKQWIN
jgi:hypothetical protein